MYVVPFFNPFPLSPHIHCYLFPPFGLDNRRAKANTQPAVNVQFLINKEMGGTPRHERCNAVLVSEGMRCRIDVTVGNTTVIRGEWQNSPERAIVGLRRKVDEMVYGRREDYLGLGE